jgi:hypothetical protein
MCKNNPCFDISEDLSKLVIEIFSNADITLGAYSNKKETPLLNKFTGIWHVGDKNYLLDWSHFVRELFDEFDKQERENKSPSRILVYKEADIFSGENVKFFDDQTPESV